jgi:hypothetical protein
VAYRMYCMDGVGSINLAVEIEASTDEEAIANAREMKPDALKCEIWNGSRLVSSLHRQDLAGQA